MKFRFVVYLLLLCSLLPVAACSSDDTNSKKPFVPTIPSLSEQMFVKRVGDDLYISAKMNSRTDIIYWFKRCLFNEIYTFYRVGITNSYDVNPTRFPENEPGTVLNLAFSDNIGPFAVAGCGWCGANHKYMERTARTAYNESYAITVDGKPVKGDMAAFADRVSIDVVNVILDPSRPYQGAGGVEELRDPLCYESVNYQIFRNNIEVTASHRFCNLSPVTIAIYYGMQSMFEGETHTFTSSGAYSNWTPQAQVSSFTKSEYPHFRRFVEKNATAFQSAFLLPDGLGDHAALGADDVMFIGNSYGKSYHKLIANKRMQNGDQINWRGVYTWFIAPIIDDEEVLCYEGIVDGRTALFIDCKKACEKTITLPADFVVEKYDVIDSNGGMRISADGSRNLKVTADQMAGCVLLLK